MVRACVLVGGHVEHAQGDRPGDPRRIGPVIAGYVQTAKNFVDQDFLDALPGKIDEAFASVGARFDNVVVGELNDKDGNPSFLAEVGQLLEYRQLDQGDAHRSGGGVADRQAPRTVGAPVVGGAADRRAAGPRAASRTGAPSLRGAGGRVRRAGNGPRRPLRLDGLRTVPPGWRPGQSFESATFNGLLSVLHKISQGGVQAFRAIVDALFDVLGAAVGMIGTFMDSAIDVGAIGDVWKWVQEQAGILAADHSALTLSARSSAWPSPSRRRCSTSSCTGSTSNRSRGACCRPPTPWLPEPFVRPATAVSRSACSRRSSATSSSAWRSFVRFRER